MDIWGWVQERSWQLYDDGHEQFVDDLEAMSSAVIDDDREKVDALAPRLIEQARSLEDGWLEIYIRHWELQNIVLNRMDGGRARQKVVEILALTVDEKNRDCPQAVCAIQDMGIAYGLIDGPGYAAERAQASRETLDRITPDWPCYTCITQELIAAHLDVNDVASARAAMTQIRDAMRDSGSDAYNTDCRMFGYRGKIALHEGDYEKALKLLLKGAELAFSDGLRIDFSANAARAALRAGRPQEALKHLPMGQKQAHEEADYFAALVELAQAGVIDKADALAQLTARIEKLAALENMFAEAEMSLWAAGLALDLGDQPQAESLIAGAEDILPKLRKPEAITPLLQKTRARLTAG